MAFALLDIVYVTLTTITCRTYTSNLSYQQDTCDFRYAATKLMCPVGLLSLEARLLNKAFIPPVNSLTQQKTAADAAQQASCQQCL